MGLKDKLMAKITARFGKVVSGTNAGLEFGLGDDKGKIFSSANSFNQVLIFNQAGTDCVRLTFGKEITAIGIDQDAGEFTLYYDTNNDTSLLKTYDNQKYINFSSSVIKAAKDGIITLK